MNTHITRTAIMTSTLFVTAVLRSALGQAPPPQPTPSPTPAAKVDSKPTLSGYAQIDYRRGDARSNASMPEQELNVRRLRVSFAGRITSRVSYTATIQGDGTNANSASFCDLYADLSLKSWATVRVGQFKYEFDMEARESDAVNPLIDRAFAANAVAGSLNGASTASSAASTARDRGISLVGSMKGAHVKGGYGLGVFQGAGRASDNNNNLGLVLNGNFEPLSGLKLNLGMFTAKTAERGATTGDKYSAWTAGGAFDRGRVFLRGEYYRGRRTRATGDQDVSGFYLTGSYSPLQRVDLLARYQALADEQFGSEENAVTSVDLSAKVYFDRRGRRSGTYLSLTYMFRTADDAFKKGLTVLNDGRGAALDTGALAGNVLAARLQLAF